MRVSPQSLFGLWIAAFAVSIAYGFIDTTGPASEPLYQIVRFVKDNYYLVFSSGVIIFVYFTFVHTSNRRRWSSYTSQRARADLPNRKVKIKPVNEILTVQLTGKLEALKCPYCAGPIQFEDGITLTRCEYCGNQIKLVEA